MSTASDPAGTAASAAQVVASLQTSLESTSRAGDSFARALTTSFTDVALKGRDLGTVFFDLAERLAGLAVKAAEKPLEQGFSQMFSGLLGGGDLLGGASAPQAQAARDIASSIVLNVSTPDAESFTRSETQVAAMIARAAALGQRNL